MCIRDRGKTGTLKVNGENADKLYDAFLTMDTKTYANACLLYTSTVSVHDEYQDSTNDPQVAYEPVLPTDTVTKITADDTGTGTGKTN